jgi:hypothetical protein
MLPKTWQGLLDALTLESKNIGTLNKISSVKLQEDIIDICINEKKYRYVMLKNCQTLFDSHRGCLGEWGGSLASAYTR